MISGQRYRQKHEAAGLAMTGTGMLLRLGAGLFLLQLYELAAWGRTAGLLLFFMRKKWIAWVA
ncbi:hypothetical protein [Paenibacillus humicola]|uniref:hypothetical protein n=1 Tax=Paenibacillus humicola TaxID=3110540 RepID=UPI00237AD0B5|nr:hypothetical protein [Paenibacillus humicola]